jgi:hypothetical protein
MVSPQLVNALCEVGDGLCRDILCLVRWVGVRHRPARGIVREHKGGDRSIKAFFDAKYMVEDGSGG